ncbi:hypothetical protein VNI00_007149 [Paramarasmius palmivorus]|uniref:Cytochrome P450 n=1 Tax=Paramarasmius palmivorus TaxID=297713 RepID=A0AAW0D4B3_9AGAR
MPGPKNSSIIWGNIPEQYADNTASRYPNWMKAHGRIFRVYTLLSTPEIFVGDLKGISYILKNDYDYHKPDSLRYLLGRVTGQGIFVVEGDEHRKQKRVMNPAFGPPQIRALTDIFVDKALELRDAWASQVDKSTGIGRIDALGWLTRMTLDVIGQAGFNYRFHAMVGQQNELNTAFSKMFESGVNQIGLNIFLRLFVPILRSLPETDSAIRTAERISLKIGKQLLAESKADSEVSNSEEKGRGKDLLSLLVRSNLSSEVPESQRLSDDKVIPQIFTFLAAGHETTSTATTWALFALTGNMEAQTKLRTELLSIPTDQPSMEDLNNLPYLDWVVRESLRLHPPVTGTNRVATKDDIIPLAEPWTDARGKVHYELPVKKGQEFIIPIIGMQKDPSIWGPDAEEFKPERWENPPATIHAIPGVWGNLLTFLGGAHACIGWRFSVIE